MLVCYYVFNLLVCLISAQNCTNVPIFVQFPLNFVNFVYANSKV